MAVWIFLRKNELKNAESKKQDCKNDNRFVCNARKNIKVARKNDCGTGKIAKIKHFADNLIYTLFVLIEERILFSVFYSS